MQKYPHINDLRTILIGHDKRLFAVLSDNSLIQKYADEKEERLLMNHIPETRAINNSLDITLEIESEKERQRPVKSEVERLMADNAKARRILNWIPAYSLERGLKKTIEWFKRNKGIYKSGIYNGSCRNCCTTDSIIKW